MQTVPITHDPILKLLSCPQFLSCWRPRIPLAFLYTLEMRFATWTKYAAEKSTMNQQEYSMFELFVHFCWRWCARLAQGGARIRKHGAYDLIECAAASVFRSIVVRVETLSGGWSRGQGGPSSTWAHSFRQSVAFWPMGSNGGEPHLRRSRFLLHPCGTHTPTPPVPHMSSGRRTSPPRPYIATTSGDNSPQFRRTRQGRPAFKHRATFSNCGYDSAHLL